MAISRTSATPFCLSSEYPAVATSDAVAPTIDSIARSALSESSYLDPRSGMIDRDVLRHLTNFLPETNDIKALPPAALVDTINCKRIGLTKLAITESENLSTWLKSLGESKNHLRRLDLQGIPLSDEIIELLPSSLEKLRVSDCSDATLLTLSKRLVNLKKLTICWFSVNVTGKFFDQLPEGLQELNCGFSRLTDDAIAKLSKRCSQLIKLDIFHNRAVTGIFFDQLPEGLQELNCDSCKITDDAIAKLSPRCSQLIKLNIHDNVNVTGCHLDKLPEGLQELACSACRITDDAIAKLVVRCPNLLSLDIRLNRAVTGSTFDQLPISLQRLLCDNCSIEDETIAKLSKCTNLVYLQMPPSDKLREILKTHLPPFLHLHEILMTGLINT